MKYLTNLYLWAAVLIASLTTYFFFWNHVDYNEIGVSYNSMTGELNKQEVGWHFTPPWVRVTYIPTIPVRVDFDGYSRFLLPKLVQFNTEYYKEFIQVEGFHYFTDFRYELREYVFSDKKWNFIIELNK